MLEIIVVLLLCSVSHAQKCLLREDKGKKTYYEVINNEDNTCPCEDCSYEIADCLQAPLDLKHSFVNLVAHCPYVPRKVYPLNITQARSQHIMVENSFVTFRKPDTLVAKMTMNGDMAVVMKKGKINVIDATVGETNLTIPKCKTNCSLQVDSATFSSMNDLYIGSHNNIDIKSLNINCSREYPSSIHVGVGSKIHAQKVVISGNTVLFTEGHKSVNMSGPLLTANELVTNRPLSLQVIDRLHPQQCVVAIQSPSLKRFPKTMQFKVDIHSLSFIQLPIHHGKLVEYVDQNGLSTYQVAGLGKAKPKDGFTMHETSEKYIEIPLKGRKVIYPLADIDRDYAVNKTILEPDEQAGVEEVYLVSIDSSKQIRIHFKNYKKYGIVGRKYGKKAKMTYQVAFKVSDMELKKGMLVMTQELKRGHDTIFPISRDEELLIPSHYVYNRKTLPFKHYQIWSIGKDKYIVFTSESQLNMFSFFTDSMYRLTRVDDQLLICNPFPIHQRTNATAVNETSVNATVPSVNNTTNDAEPEVKPANNEVAH